MKEEIIKILESYIIDKAGETRPFINPDSIESIAEDILAINKTTINKR